MYHLSRRERQALIFERMREEGRTSTFMYLYESEIDRYNRNGYLVIAQAIHPQRKELFLCEVKLPTL